MMFALITVASMSYDDPLLTFATHEAAWRWAHTHLHGDWFDIERIL